MRQGPLDRKLLRDLRRMWVQALAVSAVLACGIALFVMGTGMYASLEEARDDYYQSQRMADLAASLMRAPDGLAEDLAALAGVSAVETRVVGVGLLDLVGVIEPVSARFVSLPAGRRPTVNDLVLRAGRLPEPGRAGEVLVNEAFAEARALRPGSRFTALLYGRRRSLEVVGIASSPEFVFAVAPGELLPEPGRFGVVWMGRGVLGPAFDLDGAFNDVAVRLAPGASPSAVSAALDRLLAPHGGRGAYGRDRMLSARYLADELVQLRTMSSILPPVFLLVAVFLLNVALSRLVATERANIGLLKAFGYGNSAVALHYAKFALAFCAVGVVAGALLGRQVGSYMAAVYRSVYHIPELAFTAGPAVYLGAAGVGLAAALLGASQAVIRCIRLPPAVALMPLPPAQFGALGNLAERAAMALDAKTRMVVRRIVRYPRRSASTVVGIALGLALLVMSGQLPLAVARIIDIQFGVAQRMQLSLSFAQPADDRVLREVARLPGVLAVEPLQAVDVILSAGARRQREAILGMPAVPVLSRIVGDDLVAIPPRSDGLTLSLHLARKLGVGPGDQVRVEATDGRRLVVDVLVVEVVRPMVGAPAYMEREALGRLLREPGRVSAAHVLFDGRERTVLATRLKQLPAIAGVSFADNAQASLRKLFNEGIGFFSAMFLVFSGLMAGGVAFSAARVTLAEQERDLATLRVLGFGRGEVSYVLLAEIGLLLALALPLGIILGVSLSQWLMAQFETDLFSFPYVLDAASCARAALYVCGAVLGATLVVRRGVDSLDLVGVLKSRE